MPTRRRRWLSVLGVIALALLPPAFVLVGSVTGDQERMVSYFEVATIDADGDAWVDEVIDYDFGTGNDRHGIVRVVPGLDVLPQLSVSSPDAPDQFELTGGNIRIGDPDRTVNGTNRYIIRYDIRTLTQGDQLAWNVVGNEWDIDIESVEAHVLSERSLGEVSCDKGTFGAVGGCEATEVEPGHIVIRTGSLSAGEAVTVRATLGDPLAATPAAPAVPPKPADTGAPLLMPFVFGFLLAAAAGLLTGRIVRFAGREFAPPGFRGAAPGTAPAPPGSGPLTLASDTPRVDAADLVAEAQPRVAPPRRITAPQGGVVLAEAVQPSHKAAWLISQAQHGAIALEGDAKKPTMRWLGGHGASDNAALLTMFASRPEVQLGEYDSDFAAGWEMVEAELATWRTSSGLWDPAGNRRRWWAIGIGILLMLIGLADAVFLAYRWAKGDPAVWQLALLSVPLGIGFGMMVRAWELRVRTSAGSALYVEVEAFRRYLADVEPADVEQASDAGLMHDYLAWAVALGEADKWRDAVEASAVEPGVSYNPTFLYMAMRLSTSTQSAASTSGGGAGGGGAGGGGGGGGGGSW